MSKNDGTIDRLVLVKGDGKVAERFNLVLVAEGYRKDEASTFEADALAVANKVIAAAPFDTMASALNIFRLDVWSTQSGADRNGTKVATYFDAYFAQDPQRLLLVDAVLVTDTVEAALSDAAAGAHAHKIVVIVNTVFDGGSGGISAGVAVASRAVSARTVVHELGHLFGLVDEYDTVGPDSISNWSHVPPSPPAPPKSQVPNLSMSYALADLPWADLVDAQTPLPTDGYSQATWSTVGAFAVADSVGSNYRPQSRCRMRYAETGSFCTVCERHIEQALKAAT